MNQKLKAGNIALIVAVAAGMLAVLAIVLGVAYRPGTVDITTNPNTVNLGAVPTATISGNYFSVGGVGRYSRGMGYVNATTTVCAIQAPAATSTLVSGGASFSLSSTTASLVTIAKAATQYATTTVLATSSMIANAFGYSDAMATTSVPNIVSITTTAAANLLKQTDRTFGPNQWFVVGMQDTTAEETAGSFSPKGFCNATFNIVGGGFN